ncbi:OB-fold nucleic acid binding domain-containing protein [Streptomyces sp. NBC_00388]|uniref:OB-fold nucleic acid binding domain-containing protein n=1 Tax=Streptomyces sp. NBC_00388 TaxID=2975735 RepID=UPI002E1B80A5
MRQSGLITGFYRRMTKQGHAWAIVNLADRDGELDVLYFPASSNLVQHALIEDSVVSVEGRLNDRDGSVSIFGQEIQVLDVSSAEHGGRRRWALLTTRPPARRPAARVVTRVGSLFWADSRCRLGAPAHRPGSALRSSISRLCQVRGGSTR